MNTTTIDEITSTLQDALALARETMQRAVRISDLDLADRVSNQVAALETVLAYVAGGIGAEAVLSVYDPKTYGLRAPKV
jgi:hypothetical protein